MRIKKLIMLFLIFAIVPATVVADMHEKAGTTGASFLKIGVGARPTGMAGAYTGIADDLNSIYWNPAGLSNITTHEITAMHNVWLEGVSYEFLAYKYPWRGWGNIGVAIYLLNSGKIKETKEDDSGNYGGEGDKFSVSDWAFNLSYAREIVKAFSMGMNIKLIQQINDDVEGKTVCFDIGGLYRNPGGRLSLGLSLRNMGPDIKMGDEKFRLPFIITGGIGYRPIEVLKVGLDVDKPIDNYLSVAVGGEFTMKDIFSIRTGYKYRYEIEELGAETGIHAGCGFKLKNLGIDYAFVPYGDLGSTHRISLSYIFGDFKRKEKRSYE